MTTYLEKKLFQYKQLNQLRRLPQNEQLVDFASNDYLGLARSPLLKLAVKKEWEKQTSVFNGLGSTGSRLLTGNSSYAQRLEEKIARFHGYETALLFNCGYMANVGLLSSIAGHQDVILFDSKIHASTRDGIRLSQAQSFSFKHNDLQHLEERLKKGLSKLNRFICIESIYSTDGSKSPLAAMCELAQKYQAFLIVDEAHAVGVYGEKGEGLVAQQGLQAHVFAQVVTFGKALGVYGAIVLTNQLVKQALINFAHAAIYTTALPLHVLASIYCSYELFPSLINERRQLQRLIEVCRESKLSSSHTLIQPVLVRNCQTAKTIAKEIIQYGFDIRALLSPTVQRGQEVLRICLHAFNRENELKQLLNLIEERISYG